ncbi:hypothetical protein ACWGQ5_14690 [Streptomyces sp. NPDC055722]
MLRHEFQPGRLVAGMALTGAGVVYLGDANGAWTTPWFALIPLMCGGLCLAAVSGLLARALRRSRPVRGKPRAERDGATTP